MKSPQETEESTRRRVVALILEEGPSTAAQLATRLALTTAAVRRHLSALTESGELVERDEPVKDRGRGRPARVFALTDVGRARFHQAYDALALQVLDFLAASGGDDAVKGFAETRAREVESRFRQLLLDDPSLSPTDALARVLSESGHVATTAPVVAGAQLCQHHCPVALVAEKYPQLCEAETAAFSRILGSHVQRLATIAHGDTVCTTHIPASTPQGES